MRRPSMAIEGPLCLDAPAVVAEALAHEGPVVVDVKTALEHISPFATIASLGT
jgi:hypothetical protein